MSELPAGDTPRTDAESLAFGILVQRYGDKELTEVISADFARGLERELRAARAELEACRADAQRYRVAVNMASMGKLPESWKEGYTEAECTAAIDAARREGS